MTAGLTQGVPVPAPAQGAPPAHPRPHIIVVMADDMRADDLRFAPHLRRLVARSGLTFDNSFSPYPLCCPARASFLTGVYAHNHGVYWHKKPYGYAAFDDRRTLATSLSEAGYRTAFVGKYLNGYGRDLARATGRSSHTYVPRGWDDWYGAIQRPRGSRIRGSAYDYFNTPYNINGRVTQRFRGEYQTNTLGDVSRRLVSRYSRGSKPFFLYLSFVAPHHGGPFERDDPRRRDVPRRDGTARTFATPARPDWVKGRFDRVVTRPPGLPRGGGPSEADVSDKPRYFSHLPELTARGRKALTEVTRQRAESIYVMDRELHRLVRTLKRQGEWDDTVFMFTSDNGFFLGEHRQRTGKIKPHEPSLRVPFLVTGPGVRRGHTSHDPITTVDVAATILDLADAVAPRPGDGTSRLGTMLHGDQGWSAPIVVEATHLLTGGRPIAAWQRGDVRTAIGLRTARYSLIRYRTGYGELYDLLEDPAQLDNLYLDPAHRQVRDALLAEWAGYKDCSGADCARPLPDGLAADPATVQHLARSYWGGIERLYGR